MSKKKLILLIAAIVLMLCAGFYARHAFFSKPNAKPDHKSVVSIFVINTKQWQPSFQAAGNVKASKSVAISSEVSGIVDKINFDSGQGVAESQLLVYLRSANIQAALEKAEAALKNDFKNYQRRKALLSSHYISAADVDNAMAVVEKDRADVKHEQALLAQHNIAAPFAGVVGIRQVEIGQYISAGQSIVNLEDIDPVYIDFSIPEKWVSRIKPGGEVHVISSAYPGELFTGLIAATSNSVNMNNRSLQVRVSVQNPQKKLLTGMSVIVTIKEPPVEKIVVPQAVLSYGPEGVGVYIIDEKNIAHWRLVTAGERRQDEVVVLSGIKSGDRVVIAGQQKLHEGSSVEIVH